MQGVMINTRALVSDRVVAKQCSLMAMVQRVIGNVTVTQCNRNVTLYNRNGSCKEICNMVTGR